MAEINISLKEIQIQEQLKHLTLNEITTVTLNTDALKHNFEVLIDILKELSLKFNASAGVASGQSQLLKDLQERLEKLEHKEKEDIDIKTNEIHKVDSELKDVAKETK
jgi:hypothetical protein